MMEFKILGDICNIVSGGTPPRSKSQYWDNGNIPWIKIRDIKSKYIEDSEESITIEGLNNSSTKLLTKGTVLYTIFATLGEVGILKIDACTNQAIAGLTVKDETKILPEYLYYYLKSKKNIVNKLGRGAAQNNINLSMLKSFEIEIIDIIKQNNIIRTLNYVDNLIKLKSRELELLDELVKARFVEMFGDPLFNPKSFPIRRIDEVAYLNKGITYSPEDVSNEGLIVLRSSNIKGNKFDLEDLVFIKKEVKLGKMVHENDILMCNRNGSARLVGKVAMIPKLNANMTFGTFMTIIRSELYIYLFNYFQTEAFRQQIRFQTSVSINQISLPLLASVKVPIPPIELQNQFANFVKEVDKSRFIIKSMIKEGLL